jgi:hypothetical protein
VEDRQHDDPFVFLEKKDLVGETARQCAPDDAVNSWVLLGRSLNRVKNSINTDKKV